MVLSSEQRWFWLSLVISTAAACTPYATVPRTKPAEINLIGVKSLSVYQIDGEEGPMLAGQLEEALARSERFQMLERSHVDKLVLEHNLNGGALQRRTELPPASAFIFGAVERPTYDEMIVEQVVGCGRKGKEQCIELTRSGRMLYQANLKVVSSDTGNVVATKTLLCSKEDSRSALGGLPLPLDPQRMRLECRGQTVSDFMRMIAPYTIQESIALFEHADVPELRLANDYLRRGDTATAVEIYERAVAQLGSRPGSKPKVLAGAHYVLGVAYALSGDFDRGLEFVQRAMSIQPSRNLIDMEFRIKGWRADADELEAQKRAAEAVPETSQAPVTERSPATSYAPQQAPRVALQPDRARSSSASTLTTTASRARRAPQ